MDSRTNETKNLVPPQEYKTTLNLPRDGKMKQDI